MNAVPRSQRGVAAGTSTMFVLSGSTLSLGLAFLVMSHTMPLNYAESIFLGTLEITKSKNSIDATGNNIDNMKQNRNHNNNVKISPIRSTMILKDFLASLHYVFLLSAILMFISIIPSWIRTDLRK
jgi:hypothetical protein